MSDSVEITAKHARIALFGVTVVCLLLTVVLVAISVGGPRGVAVGAVLSPVAVLVAVGSWRSLTGKAVGPVMGTPWDITHDRYAFPGQAAKERWLRTVRRLPDGDDAEDEEC
ncbi:hypothetical protein [Haloarchaeobius iranensis]|uniref:Uncharacterized protein n=1 Tax=Haloarchaeobius iranensis TaxID=996166 RepID=A0A1G9X485_9EURY|nr:hypothetical protein [Haloarchaeobius iranensis]SDM91488.1 hypothetical protein SAMN05192554_109142 [Haloarchaeobius iranensis]